MSATPRRLALCLFITFLALRAARAAAVPFNPSVLFGKLRGLLSFVWAEVGCQVDPWGVCTPNLREYGGEDEQR